MGENHFEALPSAVYGAVLLCAAIAYAVLQRLIVTRGGVDARVIASLARDWKGKLSPVFYACGVAASFFLPWLGGCVYLVVALMWLIPDRRIERVVSATEAHAHQ
jgi:uncharacterized membrane protein